MTTSTRAKTTTAPRAPTESLTAEEITALRAFLGMHGWVEAAKLLKTTRYTIATALGGTVHRANASYLRAQMVRLEIRL